MSINTEFLDILKKSFIKFLQTNSRSNQKLKILHSFIAKNLNERLGSDDYEYHSLGFQEGKEACIKGRYLDKKVDITIRDKKTGKDVCGLAVKFVMSNYSQNSNNYFENMLGETSNIRSNNVPYFQFFCIFDTLPYYDRKGNITKWEKISEHNMSKYLKLSQDNVDFYFHTPNKTLICIIHISPELQDVIKTKKDFQKYYLNNNFSLSYSNLKFHFGQTIIYNDYETFINKVIYTIKSR